jgi:hypothetical protein
VSGTAGIVELIYELPVPPRNGVGRIATEYAARTWCDFQSWQSVGIVPLGKEHEGGV